MVEYKCWLYQKEIPRFTANNRLLKILYPPTSDSSSSKPLSPAVPLRIEGQLSPPAPYNGARSKRGIHFTISVIASLCPKFWVNSRKNK